MAKSDLEAVLEIEAVKTLLKLASLRGERGLCKSDEDLLSYTEWWLLNKTDGKRRSEVL